MFVGLRGSVLLREETPKKRKSHETSQEKERTLRGCVLLTRGETDNEPK